jgi:hypothetical protein
MMKAVTAMAMAMPSMSKSLHSLPERIVASPLAYGLTEERELISRLPAKLDIHAILQIAPGAGAEPLVFALDKDDGAVLEVECDKVVLCLRSSATRSTKDLLPAERKTLQPHFSYCFLTRYSNALPRM